MISDQAVGLIEIVKKSYDADATLVTVTLENLEDQIETCITIVDDGFGMTREDIENKWLSPAVDFKERDKQANRLTSRGRLPIGEKGVGRFAVHQLGHHMELVTRAQDQPEQVLEIDWDAFEDGDQYLDNISIKVTERDPVFFPEQKTGTRIKIARARVQWNRTILRKVHRTLRRLQSPLKEERHQFRVSLECPEYPELESIDPTELWKT